MARTRLIKPEFFKHGDLYDAERASGLPLRIAFAGLWCSADKAGRFVWKPRELKLDILPYDAVDFGAVLDALAAAGFIARYVVDGKAYGYLPSWSRHQTTHKTERASTLPPPPSNGGLTVNAPLSNGESTVGDRLDTVAVTVAVTGTDELLAADAALPVPVPAAAAPAALHAEGWSVVHVLAPTITAPPALPLSAADRPGTPPDDRPTEPEPAPTLFPSGAVPPNRKGAPKVKPAAKPRAKVAAVADAVAGGDDEVAAPAGGKYPHYPQATCAALHTLWLERRGAIDYGRFRKETAPLFTSPTPPYTLAELTGALKLCLTVLEERATNPRDRFEWGALTPARWVERAAQWVKDFRQTQEDVEHLFRLVDGAPRGVGMVA